MEDSAITQRMRRSKRPRNRSHSPPKSVPISSIVDSANETHVPAKRSMKMPRVSKSPAPSKPLSTDARGELHNRTKNSKKGRASKYSSTFPDVLRVYKDDGKKTIFDYDSLSTSACDLWRCPSSGLQAAKHHRPAGVCRRLGVISLELALTEKTFQKGRKKRKVHSEQDASSTNISDSQIYDLLKDTSKRQAKPWRKSMKSSVPTKSEARMDVNYIYGEDYHRIDAKSVTQSSLIEKVQESFVPICEAGNIEPAWDQDGQRTDPSALTSSRWLLKLVKTGMLSDAQSEKQVVLYRGLEHIPVDSVSVLDALVDLSAPSKELYNMPLVVTVPNVHIIERPSRKVNPIKIHFLIGVYANRLLFDVMTQKLQIVMAAMEKKSYTIIRDLSPPPSLPSSVHEDSVFAIDPNGPKVHFGFDRNDESYDKHSDDSSTAKVNSPTPRCGDNEFVGTGASDGTLDAFTPSGFLKLVENTGTNMDNFEQIESLLGDKLRVELMLHQKHALSFMYKMEHLEHGTNSLIWQELAFPEGGRYFYSPVLGQLRLSLGKGSEAVRGGILADEMGLGKTCSVLALVVASLSEIKLEVPEDSAVSSCATLIIVPPALLAQWVSEIFKVAGDNLVVDVFDHDTLQFQRRSGHSAELNADVVLATYQSLEKARKGYSNTAINLLLRTKWARIVLDEMQEVRSHTSSIAKNCNALKANRRWMLSGTPLFEGFTDFRGELCFLSLDPFAADTEDGFFDFAITQHLENRSRYGLETLRVLGLLLLRRSKSMIIKATGLPLLGLKPMSITFQPVAQDTSERAIYCFVEHLMHSLVGEASAGNGISRQQEEARKDKKSFLRILRDACSSIHLLNGGLGCRSQLPLLERWLKSYNRKFIERSNHKGDVFSCDEAIRFISQADDQVSHHSDFVTDLRMGHGGGVASRDRAAADKTKEKVEEVRYSIFLRKSSACQSRINLARIRWHKALECVTTGRLSDNYYASTSLFFSSLWKARRNSAQGHGWRLVLRQDEESYLDSIRRRTKCKWANKAALCVYQIPGVVSKEDIVATFQKLAEKQNAPKKIQERGRSHKIKVFSAGPSDTGSLWNALVVVENEDLVKEVVTESKQGLEIMTNAHLPYIKEQAAHAKERFELAETMAIIHPSSKTKAKEIQAQRAWKTLRKLRAFSDYKEGHVRVTPAFRGFRLNIQRRKCLLGQLESAIYSTKQSIQRDQEEIMTLTLKLASLEAKLTNRYEKVQCLTVVEALQALQHGRSAETTCPVCRDSLGENGGLVAATQCGHLSCLQCMEDWKKEKQSQALTCMECRKPVNRIITIDPTKKEDDKAIQERKNDAKQLVRKAAKLLKESGSGALDPRLWKALYETMELPENANKTRDRVFPAIPGDFLAHVRIASKLPVHSGPSTTSSLEILSVSTKVRALLKDLPRDELSVVFTSSKSFLQHIVVILEMHSIGCRGLFTGQKEVESKDAIEQWHKDEKIQVIVVQAGAAACGLTLTAASRMFLMEPFLKYEEEQQAYARLHRYGQEKAVSCVVYYTPVSIESRLLEWRKQSNNMTPADEKVKFASMDDAEGEIIGGDMDSEYEDLRDDEDDRNENEEENQTKFLLNLQS